MKKNLLGLDVGTKTIKAVQLSRDKNSVSLLAAGHMATPVAAMNINASDEGQLAASINRLIHDMKVTTTDVSASLPSSSNVITRIIQIPLMKEQELTSSITWEAEQFIPWPLSKVKIDYAIVDSDPISKRMKVQLVAAPIDLIEKDIRIIQSAGLIPLSLETEILSISRSIIYSYPTLSNLIVVSIGASITEIGLIRGRLLVYTKSLPIGGETFTRAIAAELGFELPQAEEYKKTYGLEEDKLEGKIAKIIDPFLSNIYGEMEKTIAFFKEQYPKEELNTAVVCGGSAKLPGLVLSITKTLGLDSQIANPFVNINVDPNILPVLMPDAPLYITSVGLALKDVE